MLRLREQARKNTVDPRIMIFATSVSDQAERRNAIFLRQHSQDAVTMGFVSSDERFYGAGNSADRCLVPLAADCVSRSIGRSRNPGLHDRPGAGLAHRKTLQAKGLLPRTAASGRAVPAACGGTGILRLGQTVEQSPRDACSCRRPHSSHRHGVSVRTAPPGVAQSNLYGRHDRQSYEYRSFDHGCDIARPPADECRRRSIETVTLSSFRFSVGMHHCRDGDLHNGRMGLVAARGTRSACGRAAGDGEVDPIAAAAADAPSGGESRRLAAVDGGESYFRR